MLNGGPIGFFDVGRGLKQGDPLSPILFILAQDVLSRKIHQLVMEGKIQPMVVRNGIHPTHIMFADDIFLFCNGRKKSIENLKSLLMEYQAASGQVFNATKSKCFVDGTSDTRKRQIADYFQIDLSFFPDKYLGVFLAQGKMKSIHIWYLVDYMHLRLASWSGKILNFQARLTLVNHVLSSIPIYNLSIYKWPRKVLEACEKIIRNYLWSGNAEERKCITLKWDNVYTSKEEGGLGIRKLEDVNKALLMKLLWKILNYHDEWANFFLAKYMDINGNWINYYRKSSVWNGIKWVLPEFIENTRWIVDNDFLQFFNIDQLPVLKEGEDLLIWCNSHSGVFTVSDAINKIRIHQPKLHWYKKIWNSAVLPSTSANVWKIARNVCATEENLRKKGFQFASRCYICHDGEDSIEHILWKCDFSTSLWNWLSSIFLSPKPNSFEDVLKMHKNSSPVIKELWIISSYTAMVELWFLRNAIYYDAEKPVLTKIQLRIARKVHECEVRLKGVMWGTGIEKSILQFFNIQVRKMRRTIIIEIFFYLPNENELLLCCDGASRGNPGNADYGFVVRNHVGAFIFAESGGLGITTNYVEEFISCIKALEWAV
ncbi:uncharacterized protein LOC113352401 [Papaver somniferum]|uniref:uncharacterized protein LOC113352401 n=1 Tax=Papaver somniferum TaxID=3469 RepID=UPI000E6FF2CE|nr:uncharacterized protein LOC113352401 [Papaver somniferum]